MSTDVATHRLGGPVYQPRERPPASARAVTAVTRPVNLRTRRMSFIPSTDSPQQHGTLSPVWGRFNEVLLAVPAWRLSPIATFAMLLAGAAAIFTGALVFTGETSSAPLWTLVILAASAAVAEKQAVRVASHTQTSVSVLPILFTAVVFGPIDAMFIAFCALLPYFEAPYLRWGIWTSARVLVAGTAGVVAASLLPPDPSFPLILLVVGVTALAEGLGDAFLTSVTVEIRHRGTLRSTFSTLMRVLALTGPLHVPVVAGLAYAYLELPASSVLLFIMPALAAHHLLRLYQEQVTLTSDLLAASSRMEQANLSFAAALVAALDARDAYTAGHSAAVAVYSRDIAEAMGLGGVQSKRAHLAGLLHDIGKVGLPAGILEKPGPLTLAERQEMQQHSAIGERILRNVDGYADIALIVRHHHERLDGCGYPDALCGTSIPLVSRIIAVADAYNAMTSGRPYRKPSSPDEARLRLRQGAGSQFDPAVVAAFEAVLHDAGETYRRGARPDFSIDAQWAQSEVESLRLAAA